MNGMIYTPEMINTLKELALNHKGITTITDLFNKEYNTNLSPGKIKRAMLFRNINYKQTRKGENIGSEFYHKKNGVLIKISNDGSKKDNWVIKHRYLWEQAHGKIPEGYRVIFLDNNKLNCDLDNLELVSKIESILLKKFGFHTNNKEVTKAGLAVVRYRLLTLRTFTKGMSEKEKTQALSKLYRETCKRNGAATINAERKQTQEASM
jgi:hypothetical protein